MRRTVLGRTGLTVSRIAFGAGPVSGLMTGEDYPAQKATVARALQLGINWFDTAAGYGNGASESSLGRVLAELTREDYPVPHLATKVRVDPLAPVPLRDQVLEGVRQSLDRLRVRQVTLLQLHNGVTARNGDEPASLSAETILEPGGVADALTIAREKGLARFIGLTGTGSPEALRQVVLSGRFDTIQVPYNSLNPSAGRVMEKDFSEMNYGNILAVCQSLEMGAFAIRVLAGGALLGLPPSPHTRKTPYFPLDLYERDAIKARSIGPEEDTAARVRLALEFAWNQPAIHSAILGFADPHQVETAARD